MYFSFSGYFYTKLLRIYCLSLVMKEKLVYCVPFAKCTSHHLLVTDFLAKSSSFFWREFTPQFHTVFYSLTNQRKLFSFERVTIFSQIFARKIIFILARKLLSYFWHENCYFQTLFWRENCSFVFWRENCNFVFWRMKIVIFQILFWREICYFTNYNLYFGAKIVVWYFGTKIVIFQMLFWN